MKHKILGLLLVGLILLGNPDAWGADLTIGWQLPTENCDGTSLVAGEITQIEIYVSESPIPAADLPCSTPGDDPPQGPGVVVTPADPNANEITINVDPGTYWWRARVGKATGEWSNLSNQVTRTIEIPKPSAPTITIISI